MECWRGTRKGIRIARRWASCLFPNWSFASWGRMLLWYWENGTCSAKKMNSAACLRSFGSGSPTDGKLSTITPASFLPQNQIHSGVRHMLRRRSEDTLSTAPTALSLIDEFATLKDDLKDGNYPAN